MLGIDRLRPELTDFELENPANCIALGLTIHQIGKSARPSEAGSYPPHPREKKRRAPGSPPIALWLEHLRVLGR